MTTALWLLFGLAAFLGAAVLVALLIGRFIRHGQR